MSDDWVEWIGHPVELDPVDVEDPEAIKDRQRIDAERRRLESERQR